MVRVIPIGKEGAVLWGPFAMMMVMLPIIIIMKHTGKTAIIIKHPRRRLSFSFNHNSIIGVIHVCRGVFEGKHTVITPFFADRAIGVLLFRPPFAVRQRTERRAARNTKAPVTVRPSSVFIHSSGGSVVIIVKSKTSPTRGKTIAIAVNVRHPLERRCHRRMGWGRAMLGIVVPTQ
ncbi:hypothetical protein AGDE_15950 [Angomonas deanei]|uniref:Uncharacterized protein n=1 Tax=Angomonas deanei TaxID=59799 RepID=A0A7G2CTV3_9TRYP|nr:hypothetical protein AGDE_15950 [Angomonas deanei]CAD2221662.1 hypothetical protein, conserved [Angomonas deanei]|eukprot:EPY18072.1 hypothetical protein AGDE_15950 [Angomonas deanei]